TPGSENPLRDLAELVAHAKTIGYPMILKASAGGGGRGMRVVRSDADLADSFAACTREAQSYFGNSAVFCEKYLENPRHIEVQVLFDEQGNGVHLFERDCSIQRRHQKLIEEAPSHFLNHEQRMEVGRRAVVAAKAAGYSSAGTIEFICESPEKIYFMEMNTRIQVEHTVSEEITGIDLVSWQLRVAQGEALSFKQEDIKLNGWAFEARINAEDPAKGFMPSPGRVHSIRFPAGPGVRVDSHLYPGYEIPAFYDSMVAKLIVWGPDRETAIRRLLRALSEFEIDGVPTTAKFHEAVLRHPQFLEGSFNTGFIEREAQYFKNCFSGIEEVYLDDAALLTAVVSLSQNANADLPLNSAVLPGSSRSRWLDQARNR
ncbi:MAG: ATP-grasp domain-containing protein, partial [Proteobacteria bacterium]|nr:ATP-grasp domain-containing protein [Pseudomonadota bacterium]